MKAYVRIALKCASAVFALACLYIVVHFRYDLFYNGNGNTNPQRDRSVPFRYNAMFRPCWVEDWRAVVGDDLPFRVVKEHNANNSTRIVSFSVYGDNPKYFTRVVEHVHNMVHVYPGWTARVYVHDKSPATFIQLLVKSGAHVVIVHDSQARPGNSAGAFWRFLPMVEPNTSVFVRDSDDALERYKDIVFDSMPGHKCFGGLWVSPYLQTYVRASTVLKKSNCPPPFAAHDLYNFPIRTPYGADEYFLATQVHVPQGKRAIMHLSPLSQLGWYFAQNKTLHCPGAVWYFSSAGTAVLAVLSGILCVFVASSAHLIFGSLGGACYACIAPLKTAAVVSIFNSWGAPTNTVGLLGAMACGVIYATLAARDAGGHAYEAVSAQARVRTGAKKHGPLLLLNVASSIGLICTLKYLMKAVPNAMLVTSIGSFATWMALVHAKETQLSGASFPRRDQIGLALLGALSIGFTNVSLRYNSIGVYELLKCTVIPACMLLDRRARKTRALCIAGAATMVFVVIGTIGHPYGTTAPGVCAGIVASMCGALERTRVRNIVATGTFTAVQTLRAALPWTVASLLVLAVAIG
jgi:hypothetical protein